MKKNNLKNGELFVYNLALKRDDGKVENDTVFRDKFFTEEEVKQISEKFTCSVIVCLEGVYRPVKDSFSKEHSFVVTMDAPIKIDKGEING